MCWCFIRNLRNCIDTIFVLSGYWSFVRISNKHPGFFHRHNNGSKYYHIIKLWWTTVYFVAYLRPCRFPEKQGPKKQESCRTPREVKYPITTSRGGILTQENSSFQKNAEVSLFIYLLYSKISLIVQSGKSCAFAITLLYKSLLFAVLLLLPMKLEILRQLLL